MKEHTVACSDNKHKFMEKTILKAAMELERTKSSFKSKKVKEVREMLLASIGQ